jgi:hypothetical protein
LNSDPSSPCIQNAPGRHRGSQGDHGFFGVHGASSPFEVCGVQKSHRVRHGGERPQRVTASGS